MKAFNICFLAQMEDETCFSEYETALSGSPLMHVVKIHEQDSLRALVRGLEAEGLPVSSYDGFFLSFVINHISKEFDLLKIGADHSCILNIELKSQDIGRDRIRRQLLQNRYYLRHISGHILSYTYVLSDNSLWRLDSQDQLQPASFRELSQDMKRIGDYVADGIDSLFSADDFLISPTATPDKFLAGSYFLTTQQNDFRTQILDHIAPCLKGAGGDRDEPAEDGKAGGLFLCLTGSPGTGKTLLLYDLALTVGGRKGAGAGYEMEGLEGCRPGSEAGAEREDLEEAGAGARASVVLVHCGPVNEGHRYLDTRMQGVRICQAAELERADGIFAPDPATFPRLILVDEAPRLTPAQFERLQALVRAFGAACIFSFDSRQGVYAPGESRQIALRMQSICAATLRLSDKIRSNKELTSFITTLFDLKRRARDYSYRPVDIVYAQTADQARRFLSYYMDRGYVSIHYSDKYALPQAGAGRQVRASDVAGLEFNSVAMVMDGRFYYNDEGRLWSRTQPEEGDEGGPVRDTHLYREYLFQGVSRARERLALIICGQLPLFEKVNGIKLGRLRE